MSAAEVIFAFVERAADDPTIGPSHIGLYVAIVRACEQQGGRSPVSVQSRGLMRVAKFSAAGTYHKCMRDLQAAGHIRYIPCYNPVLGSLVYLVEKKNVGYGRDGAGVAVGASEVDRCGSVQHERV